MLPGETWLSILCLSKLLQDRLNLKQQHPGDMGPLRNHIFIKQTTKKNLDTDPLFHVCHHPAW